MKKMLTMLLAAVMLLQCGAVCSFAGWQPDTGNIQVIFSEDFSNYAFGEAGKAVVDGNVVDKDLNWPNGWTVTKSANDYAIKAYADIQTTNLTSWQSDMNSAPYLKLYTVNSTGDKGDAETVKAEKTFALPEDTNGIFRVKFKYNTDHGNYSAGVGITDENGKGINISTMWKDLAAWSSDAVTVDGELQQPYASGDLRVYIRDILGTGSSNDFAIGRGENWEYRRWNIFDIVANTTDKKIVTTVGGSDISLGSGIYAVAITYNNETRIYKGVLPTNMGKFSKFSLISPAFHVNGSAVYLDDVSVEYTPVTYVNDAEFENWKGVVWGTVSSDLSDSKANMLIESDTDDMAEVGAGWARIFVGRNYNADRVDKMVLAADKKGVKPLMTYVKKTGSVTYGTEAEEAEEMAYLANLVSRYKGITKYWEIGNEPNLVSGTDTEKLTNYAKHLRDCYNTIKAADADATVILGGISEWLSEDWVAAFADITVDGKPAYKYFDEAAFHPYADNPDKCVARVTAFVDAMKEKWGTEMPIWITEVGFHSMSDWDTSKTPGYVASEDIKAQYLTSVMNKLHAKLGNMQRPVLWYILHENGTAKGYGLTVKSVSDMHVEKTLLAAYNAMKNLTIDKAPTELPVYDDFTGCEGTLPAGWKISGTDGEKGVVTVINGKWFDYPESERLQIVRNYGNTGDVVSATRSFALPADGGLVSISFDVSFGGVSKGYGKSVVLKNGNIAGASIAAEWKPGYEDGNAVVLDDNSTTKPGLCTEKDDKMHFEFVINCSNATLGGLAPGEFTVSANGGAPVKGKMKNDLTALDSIEFNSGAWTKTLVEADNISVALTDVPEIFAIRSAAAAGGNAVVELSSSKTSAKGDIVIAAYKTTESGKVMSRIVYAQPGFMISKGITTVKAPLGSVEDGESYKVFVFDTMDSLKPIMTSVEF